MSIDDAVQNLIPVEPGYCLLTVLNGHPTHLLVFAVDPNSNRLLVAPCILDATITSVSDTCLGTKDWDGTNGPAQLVCMQLKSTWIQGEKLSQDTTAICGKLNSRGLRKVRDNFNLMRSMRDGAPAAPGWARTFNSETVVGNPLKRQRAWDRLQLLRCSPFEIQETESRAQYVGDRLYDSVRGFFVRFKHSVGQLLEQQNLIELVPDHRQVMAAGSGGNNEINFTVNLPENMLIALHMAPGHAYVPIRLDRRSPDEPWRVKLMEGHFDVDMLRLYVIFADSPDMSPLEVSEYDEDVGFTIPFSQGRTIGGLGIQLKNRTDG